MTETKIHFSDIIPIDRLVAIHPTGQREYVRRGYRVVWEPVMESRHPGIMTMYIPSEELNKRDHVSTIVRALQYVLGDSVYSEPTTELAMV
jgi:hypothetical protein